MQPNPESYNIQRRPMDVEDYVDVIRRHRGWVIGPTFAGLVISVVTAFVWPDTFVSDATIRVVPPAVPERYVASNVNLQVNQRIASLYQTATSRSQLLNYINANGLYPRQKGSVPDEDLIEEMRNSIRLDPVVSLREISEGRASSTAYRVSFSYENRYLAQRIVQQVVSNLVDETTRRRATESEMTTDFLEDKVEAAKTELDLIEAEVEGYKRRFAGKLPEELQNNMATLQSLQTQLATNSANISRAQQDKILMENQLRAFQEQVDGILSAPATPLQVAAQNERMVQLERQISTMETTLAALREKYSAIHPDVRNAEATLAVAQRQRDEMLKAEKEAAAKAAEAPKEEPDPALKTREQRNFELQIDNVKAAIKAKDGEIQILAKDQARIDKMITEYQTRIEASPLAGREYSQLIRNYGLAKQKYEDLMQKSSQSAMATDLETRKQGEVLEVLEQASLPMSPTDPNRLLMVSMGTVLGLVVGLFLTGGRELRDTSLKNLKDVRAYTGLPVLGSVPLVQSDFVVQRKRRLAWLAWSTACIFGFLLMLGSVYYYYTKGA